MSYFVTWSTDDQVISEKEFDDIFKAESYIFRNRHKFEKQGATGARVWNGCATYFEIDWKPSPGQDRTLKGEAQPAIGLPRDAS